MSLPRVAFFQDGQVHTEVHPNIRGRVSSYINIEETGVTRMSLELEEFLEIYLDVHIIEVYINRGRYVISNAVWDLTGEIAWDKAHEIKVLKNKDCA